MTLSELLRRKMNDYGYKSLTEFSEALGIPYGDVYGYICCKTTYLRAKNRRKICVALDIAPKVLDRAIRNSMGG